MSGLAQSPQSLRRSHPGSTLEDLDKANGDDERQRQQLPASEDNLDARGPAYAGAVHPCQEHWRRKGCGDLRRGPSWWPLAGSRLGERPLWQPEPWVSRLMLQVVAAGRSLSAFLPAEWTENIMGRGIQLLWGQRLRDTHSGRPWRVPERLWLEGYSWERQAEAHSWRRSWR